MRVLIVFAALLLSNVATGAIVYTENFESAGGYSTSTPEFSDGAGDYFIRTDGSDHGTFITYNGKEGNSYFAANDLDGEGAAPSQTLTISNIPIANFTGLSLDILLAEDDDAANQDWDADTSFTIFASIDGGAAFQILGVESVGGTNTEPAIDTDFDGIGDGTTLTDTFTNFNATIAGSGNILELELRFTEFNAGDEDIAIDNIRINGTAVPEPTSVMLLAGFTVSLALRRRRS